MRVKPLESLSGSLFVLLFALLTVLPFLSIFVTALYPSGSVPQALAWPEHPHWENFLMAFQTANMGALLYSSSLIVASVVPVALLIATMAAFALGQLRLPGSRFIFFLFVFGLTLPMGGIIVPLYEMERFFGFYNTRLAIILPLVGLYMPFSVYWMHAHFINTPGEISEAARIDGANNWRLFWRIHMPLAKAPLSALGILMAVWTWNQFLLALVLVEDPTKRTMAGALGAFQGHYATNIPLLCAGTLLILLPTVVIFLIFQRQMIAAMLQGAVKG